MGMAGFSEGSGATLLELSDVSVLPEALRFRSVGFMKERTHHHCLELVLGYPVTRRS